MKQRTWIFLIILFLITLAVRLFLVYQTPHFNVDGYFALRQITHITETALPLYQDALSFGGKTHLFMPGFYYILAFFNLFLPLGFVAKVLPNIFASSIVFFAFLLAFRVTKNVQAAAFTAFISAFIPVFFSQTLNNISPFSLLLPLLLYQTYCFLSGRVKTFIVLSFFLPIIHYAAVVFPISLLLLLLVSKIEHVKLEKKHVEMTIFSLTVAVWLLFLVYKQAFSFHGLELFLRNIPVALIGQRFVELNLPKAVYLVGIVPFIYGVISSYQFLFREKFFEGLVLLSLVLTPFLLVWVTVVDITEALLFLGVFLTVLFSYHYHSLAEYLKKTRFAQLKYYLYIFVVSVTFTFLVTSILPSIVLGQRVVDESLHQDEFEALEWIRENTPEDATIAASLQEGDLITTLGNRKNLLDSRFILVRDASVRYDDFRTLFSSFFVTETVSIANKYDITYLYVSQRLQEETRVAEEKLADYCFTERFMNDKVTIYEVTCQLS